MEKKWNHNDFLAPVQIYPQIKQAFLDLVKVEFDRVVKDSNVNLDKNIEDNAIYHEVNAIKKEQDRKLFFLVLIRDALMFVMAIGILVVVYKAFFSSLARIHYILAIILIALLSFALFISYRLLTALIQAKRANVQYANQVLDSKLMEMSSEVKNIVDLFEEELTKKALREVLPIIEIDDYICKDRVYMLHEQFDILDLTEDEKVSILDGISGSIQGNPFLILRYKTQKMQKVRYRGEKTIYWTETRYDYAMEMHRSYEESQTLVATVDAMKPVYTIETGVWFASAAGRDLSFSREPMHVHKKSEKLGRTLLTQIVKSY